MVPARVARRRVVRGVVWRDLSSIMELRVPGPATTQERARNGRVCGVWSMGSALIEPKILGTGPSLDPELGQSPTSHQVLYRTTLGRDLKSIVEGMWNWVFW